MERSVISSLIGVFTYNEDYTALEANEGKIHWRLDVKNGSVDVAEMIKRAEELFLCLADFDRKAKEAIAGELIEYKNDFWPEYDENDENLNWDAVDAGEYNTTNEKFQESITLYDIELNTNEIYCEYDDGDLFGGHRIHAYFDKNFKLLRADV
ncbi:DUF2262 domain-containing protein [Paenibacillus polymyxa]|uniref:DUF2262 domain-containing protein n=1 Tax=Paenibacillus polymyxa TaxID=1406 RepID=UPI003F839BC8